MADPDRVRLRLRELGRALAAHRRAAGLNQFALATAVHYTRSTVANVEVGRQNAPLHFWQQCDEVLNAGGALRRGYDELCLQRAAQGREEVEHRGRSAGRLVPGAEPVAEPTGSTMIVQGVLADRLAQLLTEQVLVESWAPGSLPALPDWDADTLMTLTDLGRVDVDLKRRRVLSAAAYSVAALTVPGDPWWARMAAEGRARTVDEAGNVGTGDLAAVRDMVAFLSRIDQRRGGGHARTAVVQYLTRDVAKFLAGAFASDRVRREMFSAASELAYLAGWMSFDNAEHALARHYFTVAIKLAAEADDPPMAGHVLRAMAHQAVDLGDVRQAVELAEASIDGARYTTACSREKALLGVVHARALSAAGEKKAAAASLVRAENDLADAQSGDPEPGRVFFFGEASLAHETACALRDVDDLPAAITEFDRSVRTRNAAPFARTHAVTLGYLAGVHARRGDLDQACATWSVALDTMDGVRSGRTRRVATDMRAMLAPLRRRGVPAAAELDARAARYLAATA